MKMSCYEEGFRLNDALSVCSMRSKARIDALFEDTRSVCSSTYSAYYASAGYSINHEETGDDIKRANCQVQARIEAMFASVEAETGKSGETAAAILPVKYLGAAPVGGRVASIRGLQEPLRQLLEHIDSSTTAELEVSRRGLTFRTSCFEKTNPFRRIAVWSALKLKTKQNPLPSAPSEYAFLPLVSDDPAEINEEKYADLYRTMRGLGHNPSKYPPIFAVIMRQPGAARLLECHAFACKTEEDAIAAAATLYRALLADLDSNRRRPRQTNGLGCVSLASVASSYMDHSSVRTDYAPPPPPLRPPRTKKTSTSGSTTDASSIADKRTQRRRRISEIKTEDILEARRWNGSRGTLNGSRVTLDSSRGMLNGSKGSLNGSRGNLQDIRGNSSGTVKDARSSHGSSTGDKSSSSTLRSSKNRILRGEELRGTAGSGGSRKSAGIAKPPRKFKTFETEKNYSFVEKNGSIVGEVVVNATEAQLYEKNEGSFDVGNSSLAYSSGRERYSPRNGNESSSKSIENSIYERSKRSSREKLYEDHFRDADKIFSLDNDEDECSLRTRNNYQNVKHGERQINKINNNKTNNSNKTGNRTNSSNNKNRNRNGISVRCSENNYVNNPKNSGRIAENSHDVRKREERAKSQVRSSRIDEFCQRTGDCSQGRMSKKRNRAGSEPPLGRTEDVARKLEIKLKRSQSDLEERGDLMTRVELPRRGSFLKPGASRLPNNVNGGTPLGFTELFDEFRNQEGLTSVDDILATIIDPEGMSFNELKPLYKEFLLKLASTLTQDELYQRSANIMKRRKRPSRRRSMRKPCLLGRAIKRSVSKLKTGPTEFTSVIFPARKLNESFDSSSSCEARNSRRVLASRLSNRRRPSYRRGKGLTTSEDSDTGRRVTRSNPGAANRSSSGYVSCSECSYDSESCTCISADKCYCSLPRRSPPNNSNNNAIVCACDTDSCSESNKCYCARRKIQPSIMEQLRERGIVPSEGELSTGGGSPERRRVIRSVKGQGASRNSVQTKMRPSPGRSSSDNLALDYDLFSPGKKSGYSSGSEKVLVVSARDPQGRLVYVGGAERKKKSSTNSTDRTKAHHEALSIKKSAEIAAVFGNSSRSCRRTESFSSMKSSISLEAGLGYLP